MRGLSKVGIALVELFKTVEKVATRYQEMAISDSCFRTGRPSGYTLITMLISREEILAEIRKFVAANDGAIPGERTFLAATRIKESAWKGKHWARWTDAVREAGYDPNSLNQKIPDEDILERLAEFITKLGYFPVRDEINVQART